MDSPSTIEDPDLYKEFREINRENSQANSTPAQPEDAGEEDADGVHRSLRSPGSPAADTWSAISEGPVLPNGDAVEYSDAVKLTAEILRKQVGGISERTNEMEMSDMTESEREGDAIKDGREPLLRHTEAVAIITGGTWTPHCIRDDEIFLIVESDNGTSETAMLCYIVNAQSVAEALES
ncbi:hypothetical protein E8E11_008852 [Didymella keratinophila]|nr:hypothetical protein E8E11_008852 [Didymella keratinophila]